MRSFLLATLLVASLAVAAMGTSLHMDRHPHRLVEEERVGRTIKLSPRVFAKSLVKAVGGALPEHSIMSDVFGSMLDGDHGSAGLYGGIVQLGEFYTNFTIGGQSFRAQLDTGSSTLAIPVSGCKIGTFGGDSASHGICTAFDPPFQKTANTKAVECGDSQCTFEVRYLDNSGMSGKFYSDTIVLGGVAVENAPFGGMLKSTKNFEAPSMDGILGAAYKSLNCFNQANGDSACFPTVVDSLVAAGMDNVFGICLDDTQGRWDLGELDPSYSEDDYAWAPITASSGFYEVSLNQLTVGNSSVTVPAGNTIIVDSGTTLAILPSETWNEVEQVLKQANPPGASQILANEAAELTAEQVSEWPSLTYYLPSADSSLSGITVDLTPQAYLLDVGGGYYSIGMGGDETGGQHILGDVFMQQYYVAFNREQSKVGFTSLGERGCSAPVY